MASAPGRNAIHLARYRRCGRRPARPFDTLPLAWPVPPRSAAYDKVISELGIRSIVAGDSHKAAQKEAAAAFAAAAAATN